ncbi:IclR family transcriptional regulator [Pseudorhodoferax sp.]|uniref:IclR family transcriptional regulator n=1 Tax=Pseudorhodoferax sp. TaxID=1993553 RepID=UPI0039E5B33E
MHPTGTKVKSIDALARGLAVLRQLQYEKSMSLPGLMASTGLARATLLRILKTLAQAGHVDRNPMNGRYFAVTGASGEPALSAPRKRLSEITAPMRRALERKIPWPTNLAVLDRFEMVIVDGDSSCSLTPNYHALGFRPPLLFTAVGKALLAWSSSDASRAWIDAALQHRRVGGDFDRAALLRELQRIRRQGYAVYDSTRASPSTPARYGALAVPVFAQARCVASLAMVWIPEVMALDDVLARYLAPVQQAAEAMSRVLTAQGFTLAQAEPALTDHRPAWTPRAATTPPAAAAAASR